MNAINFTSQRKYKQAKDTLEIALKLNPNSRTLWYEKYRALHSQAVSMRVAAGRTITQKRPKEENDLIFAAYPAFLRSIEITKTTEPQTLYRLYSLEYTFLSEILIQRKFLFESALGIKNFNEYERFWRETAKAQIHERFTTEQRQQAIPHLQVMIDAKQKRLAIISFLKTNSLSRRTTKIKEF